jgi:hypothetical protein
LEIHETQKTFYAFPGWQFGIFVKNASTLAFIKVSKFIGRGIITII